MDELIQSAEEMQATISELQMQASQSEEEKRHLHNVVLTTQNDLHEANAKLVKVRD
jgi:methanogenic corrinoid protein MtbC1